MAELAPVFVNESRVRLQGEPRPQVSKIVRAAGKEPTSVQVRRLRDQSDQEGQPVRLEETIDRTTDSNAVYLRCIEESKQQAPAGQQVQRVPPAGGTPEPGTGTPQAPPPASKSQPAVTPAPSPRPPSPEPSPEPERPAEPESSQKKESAKRPENP